MGGKREYFCIKFSLSLFLSLFVGVGVSASINIANIHPYSLATER